MRNLPAAVRSVYAIDTFRQSADGVIQPLFDSVLMLVAIRYFNAGDFWKGMISASAFAGYLLSAPLTGLLNRSTIRRSGILAVLTGIAALSLLIGGLSGSGAAFAITVSLASAAIHIRQPYFTDLYGESYSSDNRARLISPGLRLNIILALVCGLVYGRVLAKNIAHWNIILFAASAVLGVLAVVLARLPGNKPLPASGGWFKTMLIPFRNPVFLYVQVSWMIVGFGNLWVQPLKSVYLAEQERGLGLSPDIVTVILVVVPFATQLLFNPIWVRLYQRLSFPAIRIFVNLFFMTSLPLFFLTDNLYVIAFASVLFGAGSAGSPFIWQLWVIRIASPPEIRTYQAAHAFLAGLRGVIAPFIGFTVIQGMSFRGMGFLSGTLALVSILMMFPMMRKNLKF
jgi:MFS family permease